MPNALAGETSPYLLQHAGNPVDWLPWGAAAFERARELQRPVLVSIGYSSCHWCHVMERESFEDEAIAELMNRSFVCVKVDREERPDVDALYMEAVQNMTGRGGWPLNVFLTPEQLPFYGGTYYPPEPRHGMPSWKQVLQALSEAWADSPQELREGGERLLERLSAGAGLRASDEPITEAGLERAVENLRAIFDGRYGGFGGAPKFPQAPVIEFLLARGEHEMSIRTLAMMASGGIHDQVGGGFSRYSVDAHWTVPHFEKMLYDNALLARAYLHGWQATGDPLLLEPCRDTLDWALREMQGPEGGFYSALDADSQGIEGRFYVWTIPELQDALGELAADAVAWLGATEEGNFADPHHPAVGWNVLQDRGPRPGPRERERIRELLLARRAERVRPGLDDKRLTSWNALMLAALADAGAALGESSYLEAAERCASFLLGAMRAPDGGLLRTYNRGSAKIDGFLDDHAHLLEALIVLFEASCEERWFHEAISLADVLIERFSDADAGGFFSTALGGEELLTRRKDLEDAPIPSGGASAAAGLLRLAQLTGEERYERQALSLLRLMNELAPRHPTAFAHTLIVQHMYLSPARPLACPVPASRR